MKGLILAAGDGSRMTSITSNGFPKELLPIGNVPTIRFPIESLRLSNITDIVVVIAPYSKHAIIDALQSGRRIGVNVSYIVQEKNENGKKGVGHAILSSKNVMKNNDFLVACGDTILCNFSSESPFNCLNPLIRVHSFNDAFATLLVHSISTDPTRFGIVKFKELTNNEGIIWGEIEKLVEKPNLEIAKHYKMGRSYFVISGYYLFNQNIFDYIEQTRPGVNNEIQITDAINLALKNGEKICAVFHGCKKGDHYLSYEYWDVGVPNDYAKSNIELIKLEVDRYLQY